MTIVLKIKDVQLLKVKRLINEFSENKNSQIKVYIEEIIDDQEHLKITIQGPYIEARKLSKQLSENLNS